MLTLDMSRSFFPFILALLFGCVCSTATSATTLESLLKKQSVLMAAKQANLEMLEARLASYEENKAEAHDRLEKALAGVVDARIHLEITGSKGDAANATQRELAQRSLALAEQSLEGRQGSLNRIEKKLFRTHAAIKEQRNYIERQQSVIASLKRQIAYQRAQSQRQEKFAALVPRREEVAAPVAEKGDIEVITSAALAADIARIPSPTAGAVALVPLNQE